MGLKLANFQEKFFRKMDYTVQQKVWTVIWYGMHGQPKKVQIEYRKKFGRHAKTPTRHAIHNWWQKIFETGSVNKRPKTKAKWARTQLTEVEVMTKFREAELNRLPKRWALK